MPLTDIQIRNCKSRERDWKLFDGNGLYLLVRPNGSKLWQFKYRNRGREQKLSFGPYPLITLKHARARRDEARLERYNGGDPARRRREERVAALAKAGIRFNDVAREYIAKRRDEGLAPATIAKADWFRELLCPALGKLPVAEITPHELLGALRTVEHGGRRETARRVRAFASRVFRYAVATLRATADPAQLLAGALTAPVTRHYAAVTEPSELGRLLRSIDGYTGAPVTCLAIRLAPHVFLRPGELRGAGWKEIDLDQAIWRVPAERMKSRLPHRLPLSKQAKAILGELAVLTGRVGLVFPSPFDPRRALSENALNAAFRRVLSV